MIIYKHELKNNRNSTIIWSASILALVCLYIMIYPSFASAIDPNELLKNFPTVFKKSFGFTANIDVFPGFYPVIVTLASLAGAIFAMNLGTSLNSKEISHKTADFLLSKPIARSSIFKQKYFAGFTLLITSSFVIFLLSWLLMHLMIDTPLTLATFFRTSSVYSLLQIFFFSLGFFVGAIASRIKTVVAVTFPVVFGFYFFGLLDTAIGEDKIRYLTPFKSFDVHGLALGQSYELNFIAYISVICLIMAFVGFWVFNKRDIGAG